MSIASKVGKLAGHQRGSRIGYNASRARLTDFSGAGLHLPKLAGQPAFGTYSGREALIMRGDVYFGPPLLGGIPTVPPLVSYTRIAVVWVQAPQGGVGDYNFFQTIARQYAGGDRAWQTPLGDFNSGDPGVLNSYRMSVNGDFNSARTGSLIDNINLTHVPGAWNVFQFVVDPFNAQLRGRIGAGTWEVCALPAHRGLVAEDDLRLGYRSQGPIDPATGKDFAFAQLITIQGDPATQNSEAYNALIASLMADPTL